MTLLPSFQGTKIFCRNSISAELPSNTTNTTSSNITKDQNETQVTVADNAYLNNSSNDNSSSIDFHEEPIDFAENPINFHEEPIDFAEPSDNETGEPLDFSPTTTSTSSTTVTSTTSTMTTTTSTTETSMKNEFFIARNKASSVLNEIRLPRSDNFVDYRHELSSEHRAHEEAWAKYYDAFGWFQI